MKKVFVTAILALAGWTALWALAIDILHHVTQQGGTEGSVGDEFTMGLVFWCLGGLVFTPLVVLAGMAWEQEENGGKGGEEGEDKEAKKE